MVATQVGSITAVAAQFGSVVIAATMVAEWSAVIERRVATIANSIVKAVPSIIALATAAADTTTEIPTAIDTRCINAAATDISYIVRTVHIAGRSLALV